MSISMKRVSAWALGLAIASGSPHVAQAQDAHAGHHPAEAPPPAASPAPAGKPDGPMGGAPAMGGQHPMMGGRDMPMQGMMGGQTMPMCGMMGGGMKMSDRINERITTMRSELGITPAQSRVWDAYASALRAIATNMDRMHDEMMSMPQGAAHLSPLERLDRHDRMLTQAQNSLRTLRPALAGLYASLSDAQKQKADGLLVPGCDMGRGMPMGDMKPGMPMDGMKKQ